MTSAHLRKDQADAHPSEFGDSVECASFIPFYPWTIRPFKAGSVAVFDRHEHSEREIPNDGKTEARPGNLTARGGNVSS